MIDLIPVDLKRCQTEKKVGAWPTGEFFMSLGPKGFKRSCESEPIFVAIETEPGEDGRRGAMSLCGPCKDICEKQMPGTKFVYLSEWRGS